MADGGAEKLRKQIAFLSNLIDSHKNDKCQKESPVLKNIPNSKQHKSWSRWKSDSALLNKSKTHLVQNRQLNQRAQGNKIPNSGLSRNVKASNRLSSRKATTHNGNAVQLGPRLQNSTTTFGITPNNILNATEKPKLTLKSEVTTSQQPAPKITALYYVAQLTNQHDPGTKYKLHRKVTSTNSAPPATSGYACSSKTTDKKVLKKAPLSGSCSGVKTPFKMAGSTSSSGHAITPQNATFRQPKGNLKWSKNDTIKDVKSRTENKVPSNSTVAKTLTKDLLSSSLNSKPVKPLTKTASLPATTPRRPINNHSNTTLDRRHTGPLTKNPLSSPLNSKPLKPLAKTVSLPATTPRRPINSHSNTTLDRRHTGPLTKNPLSSPLNSKPVKPLTKTVSLPATSSLTATPPKRPITNHSNTTLDRRYVVPLAKNHTTNPKVSTGITKGIVQTVSKGAKLKWRRRSASQLRSDSSKSKDLFGNNLQTRIALKSKWGRGKPSATTLRKTSSSGVYHRKTPVNHVSKNAKPKRVLHSQHTKNILQSRTIPRRSRLKWSKSLSATNLTPRSGEAVPRKSKAKFDHNSRFSLKRRKSSEGKVFGVVNGGLGSSRVLHSTGAVSRVRPKNKGFVSRRMKYVALGSQTQNKSFASKYSLKTTGQLRRKVTIGGNHYVISSHGKTLKKTVPSKDNKTKFSTFARRNSLHVYRNPNAVSSTPDAASRIFQRQSSVDNRKTRKANKILKRTLQTVLKKFKKQKSKSEEYCMFYNKFGKCTKHKQGICPYIHDPTKIAVCTRFLRGKCQDMDGKCPFSHKIDKEKMPICQYFLKGKCNRDDCPYSHVNVGRQAVVCEDFLKGYCALGFKCKKKHVLECEEFSTTGQCPNGSKCKLIHRNKLQQRKRYFGEETLLDEEECARDAKKARRSSSEGFLPLEGSTISEDERLNSTQSHGPEQETESNVSIRIRPHFANQDDGEL